MDHRHLMLIPVIATLVYGMIRIEIFFRINRRKYKALFLANFLFFLLCVLHVSGPIEIGPDIDENRNPLNWLDRFIQDHQKEFAVGNSIFASLFPILISIPYFLVMHSLPRHVASGFRKETGQSLGLNDPGQGEDLGVN